VKSISSSKGYYWQWHTRIGTIGVDSFKSRPRFGHRRGRCLEHEFRFAVSRSWTLELSTSGKSYRELVDAPKELENLDWVIDEFDSNFNALAVASLRYHQKWSVCQSHQRYEDLITRLTEPRPEVADSEDERATLRSWDFPRAQNASPAVRELLDRYGIREQEYLCRMDIARHDFVDIMRELWS
jgi:hypothetical protein